MLIEFYGKNFGCFRDEFRLSLLATDIDPGSDRGVVEVKVEGDAEPLRLLRAIALYGPNASGKSTLVRAVEALSALLSETRRLPSDHPLDAYEPFSLGPERKQPTWLGAKAVVAGAVYNYAVLFDRKGVLAEQLQQLSGGTPTLLFNRNHQNVVGEWSSDEQFALLSARFRPNALLLSLADSIAPKLAKSIAVGIRNLLTTHSTERRFWEFHDPSKIAERARNDTAFGAWLAARLRSADVGIVDIRPEQVREIVEEPEYDDSTGEQVGVSEVAVTRLRLTLLHGAADGAAPLPFSRESLGTRRMVALSPLIYEIGHGRRTIAVFIDEFDASIHPLLLQDVVRHLNCEIPSKAVRGQLIFTTHETTLLDDEAKDAVLRRDQIYFTEKDRDGASRLFSVADFKERNNLNIRRRYLQGRYGALPALGSFSE